MRRENPWGRLVFGTSILAVGVIFWFDRIGTIDARDYLEWWPLALIAMGLANLPARRWGSAAVLILLGVFFLSPIQPWRIIGMWPLLISVAGVTLMIQAFKPPSSSGFRALAVMGANERTIGSQEFRGGEAVAVMGGCDIDLSSARLVDGAVIDILAFWGGVDVRVPSGVRVVNHILPILGGVEDKTAPAGENAPRLILRGAAIMGGVGVRTA